MSPKAYMSPKTKRINHKMNSNLNTKTLSVNLCQKNPALIIKSYVINKMKEKKYKKFTTKTICSYIEMYYNSDSPKIPISYIPVHDIYLAIPTKWQLQKYTNVKKLVDKHYENVEDRNIDRRIVKKIGKIYEQLGCPETRKSEIFQNIKITSKYLYDSNPQQKLALQIKKYRENLKEEKLKYDALVRKEYNLKKVSVDLTKRNPCLIIHKYVLDKMKDRNLTTPFISKCITKYYNSDNASIPISYFPTFERNYIRQNLMSNLINVEDRFIKMRVKNAYYELKETINNNYHVSPTEEVCQIRRVEYEPYDFNKFSDDLKLQIKKIYKHCLNTDDFQYFTNITNLAIEKVTKMSNSINYSDEYFQMLVNRITQNAWHTIFVGIWSRKYSEILTPIVEVPEIAVNVEDNNQNLIMAFPEGVPSCSWQSRTKNHATTSSTNKEDLLTHIRNKNRRRRRVLLKKSQVDVIDLTVTPDYLNVSPEIVSVVSQLCLRGSSQLNISNKNETENIVNNTKEQLVDINNHLDVHLNDGVEQAVVPLTCDDDINSNINKEKEANSGDPVKVVPISETATEINKPIENVHLNHSYSSSQPKIVDKSQAASSSTNKGELYKNIRNKSRDRQKVPFKKPRLNVMDKTVTPDHLNVSSEIVSVVSQLCLRGSSKLNISNKNETENIVNNTKEQLVDVNKHLDVHFNDGVEQAVVLLTCDDGISSNINEEKEVNPGDPVEVVPISENATEINKPIENVHLNHSYSSSLPKIVDKSQAAASSTNKEELHKNIHNKSRDRQNVSFKKPRLNVMDKTVTPDYLDVTPEIVSIVSQWSLRTNSNQLNILDKNETENLNNAKAQLIDVNKHLEVHFNAGVEQSVAPVCSDMKRITRSSQLKVLDNNNKKDVSLNHKENELVNMNESVYENLNAVVDQAAVSSTNKEPLHKSIRNKISRRQKVPIKFNAMDKTVTLDYLNVMPEIVSQRPLRTNSSQLNILDKNETENVNNAKAHLIDVNKHLEVLFNAGVQQDDICSSMNEKNKTNSKNLVELGPISENVMGINKIIDPVCSDLKRHTRSSQLKVLDTSKRKEVVLNHTEAELVNISESVDENLNAVVNQVPNSDRTFVDIPRECSFGFARLDFYDDQQANQIELESAVNHTKEQLLNIDVESHDDIQQQEIVHSQEDEFTTINEEIEINYTPYVNRQIVPNLKNYFTTADEFTNTQMLNKDKSFQSFDMGENVEIAHHVVVETHEVVQQQQQKGVSSQDDELTAINEEGENNNPPYVNNQFVSNLKSYFTTVDESTNTQLLNKEQTFHSLDMGEIMEEQHEDVQQRDTSLSADKEDDLVTNIKVEKMDNSSQYENSVEFIPNVEEIITVDDTITNTQFLENLFNSPNESESVMSQLGLNTSFNRNEKSNENNINIAETGHTSEQFMNMSENMEVSYNVVVESHHNIQQTRKANKRRKKPTTKPSEIPVMRNTYPNIFATINNLNLRQTQKDNGDHQNSRDREIISQFQVTESQLLNSQLSLFLNSQLNQTFINKRTPVIMHSNIYNSSNKIKQKVPQNCDTIIKPLYYFTLINFKYIKNSVKSLTYNNDQSLMQATVQSQQFRFNVKNTNLPKLFNLNSNEWTKLCFLLNLFNDFQYNHFETSIRNKNPILSLLNLFFHTFPKFSNNSVKLNVSNNTVIDSFQSILCLQSNQINNYNVAELYKNTFDKNIQVLIEKVKLRKNM